MSASLSGGERLQAYLKDLAKRASGAKEVACGFWSTSTYPDGKNVATIAFFNEFGTGSAPPRPFFRRMVALGSPHWGADLGKLMTAANYDSKVALGQMGLELKNELQASITAQVYAPLARSTIEAKGHDQQLVDTGRMLQSVDSKVS